MTTMSGSARLAVTGRGHRRRAGVGDGGRLGAGTGKLTRLLLARFRRVIAVEPDEEMRRLLVLLCPDAEVAAGNAEAIPFADRSVDALFAAEAFHWFDGEPALAEIERVLRPRGALILMWNVPAGPTEPSIASVERLLTERAPAREQSAMTLSTSTPPALRPVSGVPRLPARGSTSSARRGFPTRRRSTARRWSRSSSRWAGWATSRSPNGDR